MPLARVLATGEKEPMRLRVWLGLSILLLGAVVSRQGRAESEALKVVATFSILGDFVANVGGDKVAVTTLVGPDADTHTYQPTPADARAVAEARILVTNGLGLEGWLDRLKGAARSSATVVVASAGVEPLMMDADGSDKAAASGQPKAGSPRRLGDPHAWQSLANGRIYVANITKALAEADPPNAELYSRRGAAYADRLAALDGKVRDALAALPLAKRRVITTHDAFQYYGKEYGVVFIAPLGISTDSEPSAGDIARLERQIKREQIKALFLENVANRRLIEQIAKDTGAAVGPPLFSDALSKPDGPAGTYIMMFEHNTAALVAGMMKN
jgi:zinc/manganese transport system substrate-binding protein